MRETTQCPVCGGPVSTIGDKKGRTIVCNKSLSRNKDEKCTWTGEKILDDAKDMGDRKNKRF